MRAARFYGPGDIRVEDVPIPTAKANQVTVDVNWCGICGSDLHEYIDGPIVLPTAEKPHPATGQHIPLTLGHELCGRVRNPPGNSKFRDGDAVIVDPRVVCRRCAACRDQKSHCCENLAYVGGSVESGGFGETVVISEEKLLKLPDEIPIDHAAVIEPLAVVWHAIKGVGISEWRGRDVLVIGGGPIGFALLLCLRAVGANQVIVSEPTSARRAQIAEFTERVLNPAQDDVVARCQELTGGKGVEVVFDCAGAPAGLDAGFKTLKHEGFYMMVAVWDKPIPIPCWTLLQKHITLKGTLIMGDGDFAEVMQLIADGRLSGYEKMITSRIALNDIVTKGFEELIANRDSHIKVLVDPRP